MHLSDEDECIFFANRLCIGWQNHRPKGGGLFFLGMHKVR